GQGSANVRERERVADGYAAAPGHPPASGPRPETGARVHASGGSHQVDRFVPDCRVSVDGQTLEGAPRASLTKGEIDLDVSLFSRCRITFTDPDLALIDGDTFMAGTRVTVDLGSVGQLSQVFDGEVVALEPSFRRDLPPSLVVVCLDSLHRLALGETT